MPEPAADLTLYLYENSRDCSDVADEVVSECGFWPGPDSNSVIEMSEYTAYHYQPFENRTKNIELIDECVEQLTDEFPNMEVWVENSYNKDQSNPVTENYFLYVAPTRETVEDESFDIENLDSGDSQLSRPTRDTDDNK